MSHSHNRSMPSRLHNASFDAARPPGGSHSPMLAQGRSVRELEEQISTLRKENFNLKLRIYFMEENQASGRGNLPIEILNKQLIDAKIEAEMLRKTVDEKMELLKDAARAITHHEEKQRKADLDSQTIIDGLQEQIRAYEFATSNKPGDNIDFQKLRRLELEVQKLNEELLETNKRHTAAQNELEFTLAERLESLTACEAKIEELAIKNAEMVELLELNAESSDAANKGNYQEPEKTEKLLEVLIAALENPDAQQDLEKIKEFEVLEADLGKMDVQFDQEKIEKILEAATKTPYAHLSQKQIEDDLEKLDGKDNNHEKGKTVKDKGKKKILSWIINRRGRKIPIVFTKVNYKI